MNSRLSAVETQTGQLFGDLWHKYDDTSFKHSVELWEKRWLANGESPEYFIGKKCLDVGCGGGRYTIAMALMGAKSSTGVDVGEEGLQDGRKRVEQLGLRGVQFCRGSAFHLDFPENHFDFVCCSGVLHHTPSVEQGLRELCRVTKPGGGVYLLLYGAGGLYWPLNLVMRSFARILGKDEVDRCSAVAGLPANKRRTVLDDLFVPILETYSPERVEHLLTSAGFKEWRRWTSGKLDHESSPSEIVNEVRLRERIWQEGANTSANQQYAQVELKLSQLCRDVAEAGETLLSQQQAGLLAENELHESIIGTGHHRLIAQKAAA